MSILLDPCLILRSCVNQASAAVVTSLKQGVCRWNKTGGQSSCLRFSQDCAISRQESTNRASTSAVIFDPVATHPHSVCRASLLNGRVEHVHPHSREPYGLYP